MGIPKRGSSDRRPFSILPFTYRIWARRVASHLGSWADSWMPKGVHGARNGISASDAIFKVSLRLERLKYLNVAAASVTLDQEKFFDRLLLSSLEELAAQANLTGCFMRPLIHYRHVRRHIFLDGGPTGHILHGPGSCGIPQGCPLGPFFANLAAAAWETMASQFDQIETFTYLDDRFIIMQCPTQAEHLLQLTEQLDASLGTNVNIKKSGKMLLGTVPALGAGLQAIPTVKGLEYLGTDITFLCHRPRAGGERLNEGPPLRGEVYALVGSWAMAREGDVCAEVFEALHCWNGL